MSTQFDETLQAVEVTHGPARTSSILAIAVGLVAVVTTMFGSLIAFLVGLFGLAGFGAGLFVVKNERLTLAATGVIFLGVVLGGIWGNPEVFTVMGALMTILAFDYGQNAFSVGNQLSTEAETQRGELVHAAASFVVGSIAVTFAFAIYLVAGTGYTTAALTFVLLAAILLAWAIRS